MITAIIKRVGVVDWEEEIGCDYCHAPIVSTYIEMLAIYPEDLGRTLIVCPSCFNYYYYTEYCSNTEYFTKIKNSSHYKLIN
jgi:hypothetical protein